MFKLRSQLSPKGDQARSIAFLSNRVAQRQKFQVLLGVTGSGKTFTMAHVIQNVQKPTLILVHNKTLAAQLYQEFKTLFPHNAVEYFVSYYDYYQPEAYIARTNTYIEKDLAINDRIDRLRLRATCSLLERGDVIIISSISCIYGLGMPSYFREMRLRFCVGNCYDREEVVSQLIDLHYQRSSGELVRAHFRMQGSRLEVMPAYEDDCAISLHFGAKELEKIEEVDPLTGRVKRTLSSYSLYPTTHYITPRETHQHAMEAIRGELAERQNFFRQNDRLVEEQRIYQRTTHDLELIREIGYCKGIENYSRHFEGREVGEPPPCLLNYFPKDFLLFIDESHQTVPQVRAMQRGDRARKHSLIEFGFRLPSSYDNRPLTFDEFYHLLPSTIFVSATPGSWEMNQAGDCIVEQIIRPTGLLDPFIELHPALHQLDHSLHEIHEETRKGGRVLVTTLTKKFSEDIATYLQNIDIKAKYLHSDIETLERIKIIRDFRQGIFDVLIGINLLREGLDLPEVSLVLILDADKEGFLRSETSLIQTCGRAARNARGRVVMYADRETSAIKTARQVTNRRRILQEAYNQKHKIIPHTVRKEAQVDLSAIFSGKEEGQGERKWRKHVHRKEKKQDQIWEKGALQQRIRECEEAMRLAAKEWRFVEAEQFKRLVQHYQGLQAIEKE